MKKLAIILGSLVVLFAAAFAVVNWVVIDRAAITTELQQTLEKATGRDVRVNEGEVAVSLLPKPIVTLPGLRVGNIKGASNADFLSASQVALHLNLISLLTGKTQIAQVDIDGALFDFETLPSGDQSWKFSSAAGKGEGDGFKTYFQNTPIRLSNSVFRYTNAATGTSAEVSGLAGVLQYEDGGKSFSYKGKLTLAGEEAEMTATMASVDMTQPNLPDVPLKVTLEQGAQKIVADGKIVSAGRDPEFVAALDVTSANLAQTLALLLPGVDAVTLAQMDQGGEVSAKGNARLGVSGFELQNVTVLAKGDDPMPLLKGTVELQYRFGQQPQLRFIPKLEMLDLDYFLSLYSKVASSYAVAAATGTETAAPAAGAEKPFSWYGYLQKLRGGADLTAENVIYNGRTVKFLHIRAFLDKGTINISELKANLPGESWATLSGVVALQDRGLQYSGKLDVQGRRMEEFLSLFAPKDAASLPDAELGMFAIRTNMALTPEQFRLSELQARIEDTRAGGTLVVYREDRPRLMSYLRVAGMNLDTIAKTIQYVVPQNSGVHQVEASDGRSTLFNTQYVNSQFDWLSSIGMQVESDFRLDDFVLFERQGKKAEFKLRMDVGKISLEGVNATYNGSDFTGNYALLVEQGKNPRVEIKGTASELNLADLFPAILRVQNEQEWQKKLDETIDLQLLQTYTARIEGKIGKLILRNYEFEDVDTLLTLEKNTLAAERFTGKLWNGGINVRTLVQAGNIPSLSVSLSLKDADLTRFSDMTALVKHAAGRVSTSTQISTSGVSLRSWFNNATGAAAITGRDVSVQGFGLVPLARAVAVARTVSDLMGMKSSILHSGVTRLNTMQGQLNIGQGTLGISRFEFAATEARGTVDGTANLVDETLDVAVQFYLLSTVEPGETPPNMTLTLKGPIDKLEKGLDMQQVEAFVAKKAAERMLNR